MTKYCIYVHPSVPPVGIKVGVWYSLEELKERFTLEEIVFKFQGANFGFEELEEVYPKKKEVEKEVSKNKK